MAKNDGKNKFFRTLDLDTETRKLIKSFRLIKKDMLDEPEERNSGKKRETKIENKPQSITQ